MGMDRNGLAPDVTVEEFTQDMLGRHAVTGPLYRRALWVSGLLLGLGVAGFVVRAVNDGFDDRLPWGYFAATVAFLLTTVGSAPVVIVAIRAVKAHWGRPMARIAELYAVAGALVLLMFIPLLFLVPSAAGRHTLWFQDTDPQTLGLGSLGSIPGAPHLYVTVALVAAVICGVFMLLISVRPDRQAIKQHRAKGSVPEMRSLYGMWQGSRKQWNVHQVGLGVLGGLFFIMLVGAHVLFSVDFAMALVPGWRDSIFPVFQALSGLQAGLATVLVTLFLVRRYGGLERYIHMEHFWSASKILLALTLLWFYFGWSGFIVFWYGRTPLEQNLLQTLMFGPYRVVFYLSFILCFLAPFSVLLWNGLRKTTWAPPLAAAFILVGSLFEKMRLYVPSYSIPMDQITSHALDVVPATRYPDVFDLMMVVGGIAGAVFLVLLAARVAPIISLWEMAEGIRLRVVRPFLRTQVTVLGKPE